MLEYFESEGVVPIYKGGDLPDIEDVMEDGDDKLKLEKFDDFPEVKKLKKKGMWLIYKKELNDKFQVFYGDLLDGSSLLNIIEEIKPDEIYNLAAQSHVRTSFDVPEYTTDVNALGTLRLLEAIRRLKNKKKIKFYQASTSEIFGNTTSPQSEKTPFKPASPYAISKLYAYWITKNYRDAYNIFAVNGILFNHEGCRRGETFVTRKITSAVATKSENREPNEIDWSVVSE